MAGVPRDAAFPPRLVVGRQRDVGEDRVVVDHLVGVAVGLRAGARHDAEEARLGVDRAQPAVRAQVQPGDVLADRPDLPARHGVGRDQHAEVGLAAGRRERAEDVVHLAARVLEADDQHVLGEPALAARLPARDAQRVALLAEQRVAAVARADALDREFLGEMHDEAAVGIEVADRVQALDEGAVLLDALQRRRAHARHDAHVEHDVRAVGDLDAAARVGRVDRAHAVGHDVHRAALHAAVEQGIHLAGGLGRVHPVVVRAGVVLVASCR